MKESFKDLSYEELLKKRDELIKHSMDLRFKKVMGHVENPLEKRMIRRKVARLNTIIHEYALGMRKK